MFGACIGAVVGVVLGQVVFLFFGKRLEAARDRWRDAAIGLAYVRVLRSVAHATGTAESKGMVAAEADLRAARGGGARAAILVAVISRLIEDHRGSVPAVAVATTEKEKPN